MRTVYSAFEFKVDLTEDMGRQLERNGHVICSTYQAVEASEHSVGSLVDERTLWVNLSGLTVRKRTL